MIKQLLFMVDVVDSTATGLDPVMTDKKINVRIPFSDDLADLSWSLFSKLVDEALTIEAGGAPDPSVRDLFPEAFA